MARHLPMLKALQAWNSRLGWEGVNVIARNLTKMEMFSIYRNEEVVLSASAVGILPSIKELDASTSCLRRKH